MTETYVCANCEDTVTRSFAIRSLIRTCDTCDTNGRFLHQSLVESLGSLPEEELPENWETMPLDEQFREAIERGLIRITRE